MIPKGDIVSGIRVFDNSNLELGYKDPILGYKSLNYSPLTTVSIVRGPLLGEFSTTATLNRPFTAGGALEFAKAPSVTGLGFPKSLNPKP